ncbi:MAG: carboxypeptidase-like regulatory domain-containing protein [Candidatus Sericytochromatia bacterium]|nr:carboxypeptidase-like regulatory domain-containing protein [Candidatus Sericytochromatia bacterium]
MPEAALLARQGGLITLLLCCGGCWGGVAPGTISGLVTYDGRPAAGKRVQLLGGEARAAATDANGRYTFTGVQARRYQVVFRSEGDAPRVVPNEVAEWRSLAFEFVDGSGKEVPTFEVAYNGLLYPDDAMALVVSEEAVVPFHWSVHPRAQRYRVRLESEAGGFRWSSPWVGEPTAIFGQAVAPGRYRWAVEVDGGESGSGWTRSRQVDL